MQLVKRVAGWTLLCMLAVGATGCNNNTKSELERSKTEAEGLRNQVAELQDALNSSEKQKNDLAAENSKYRMDNQTLQTQLDQSKRAAPPPGAAMNNGFGNIQGVGAENRPGEVVAVVQGDILFDSGQVKLKPGARKTLDEIASVLNGQYADKTIRIEGHTDSDPIRKSSWKTNDRLSAERAMAVKDYLASKGVSGKRMYIAGMGSSRPKATKQASRRVEIVVIMNQ